MNNGTRSCARVASKTPAGGHARAAAGESLKPPDLVMAWRARAEELKPYAPAAAQAFEAAALDLEQALRAADLEPLKLRQAARESGYDEDHLGDLVRAGRIPNAGRKNAPRILRRDLPRKPGSGAGATASTSFAAIVREASGTRTRR